MKNIESVIDFHTHILPCLDDGSQSEAMTEAMFQEEASQGVTLVVATPHFYADRMSVGRFLAERDKALEKVKAISWKNFSMPEIALGAEVLYFPGMGRAKDIAKLCVGNSSVLLLEMPFEQWREAMLMDIWELQSMQGLKLVLAHVERYIGFQRDRSAWEHIMEMDVTFQLNAGSFLHQGFSFEKWKKTKFCLSFLAGHANTIIGSDCHNMTSRKPNLFEARMVIDNQLGRPTLERIDRAAREILQLQSMGGQRKSFTRGLKE